MRHTDRRTADGRIAVLINALYGRVHENKCSFAVIRRAARVRFSADRANVCCLCRTQVGVLVAESSVYISRKVVP